MSVEELYQSRDDFRSDANGNRYVTRLFRANVKDPVAAEAMFFATPGATIFPPDPSMEFDSIIVRKSPTGVEMRIEAIYSNYNAGRMTVSLRRLTFPPPEYGWANRDYVVEVPANELQTLILTATGETVDMWKLTRYRVQETRNIRTVKWRYYTNDTRDFDTISAQKGRIHRFSGGDYRFIDGAISRLAGVKHNNRQGYDVTGTWEQDKGTIMPVFPPPEGPWPGTSGQPRFWILQPINVTQPANMLRPPYATLQGISSPDPQFTPHPTLAIFPFATDANGWMSLPGVPDLD